MSQCQGNKACEGVVTDKYKQISAEQQKSVVECRGAQACVDKANEVGKLQADYANRTNELLEKARANGGLSPEEQNELSILQVTTIQLEADRNAAIHNALTSGDSEEAKQLAINSLAQAVGTSAAGIAAGIGKGSGAKEGKSSTIVPGGGLAAHEKAGGHLIARHVGQSETQLANRLATDPRVRVVSTFSDRAAAESAISNAIGANQSAIGSFMKSNSNQIVITYSSPTVIGSSMTRGSTSSQPVSNVTVVIRKDPTMPDGYRIHTGYPTP